MPLRIDQSALQSCDLCKRKKIPCSGERPCANCYNNNECKYSMERHRPTLLASSVPQSRRLSSGSACETCRRRKTKCDGQQPCNYCSTNGIECLNNSERRKRGLPPVAQMPMKIKSSHKRGNQETATNTFDQGNAGRTIQMIDHHVILKTEQPRRRPLGRSEMGSRTSSLSDSTSDASSLLRNNNNPDYERMQSNVVEAGDRPKQLSLRISQSPPSLSPINLSSPTSSPPFATSPLPSQSRSVDIQLAYHTMSQSSRYHIPPMHNQAPPSIRAIGQQIAHIDTHAQDDIGIPTPPASSDSIDLESVYKRKIPSVMDQLSDRTFNSLETYSASFPIYPLHSAMELQKP